MDFSVDIINLVKFLKSNHIQPRNDHFQPNRQKSGTSIGANIREARYAHGKADFLANLQIALKEAKCFTYSKEQA